MNKYHRGKIHFFSVFLIFWFIQHLYSSQKSDLLNPDTVLFELEPITVTASRFPIKQQDAVFAVTPIDKVSLQTARRQLSLKESLGSVPGLLALNENNFAQDLRLSIRGFGARASFGIRGIKVLIDGIPETTPDGQTQLDNLNIGMIDHIEVVRGPTSALYGNASGGIIHLSSQKPPKTLQVENRLVGGSYGFKNFQIKAGQDFGDTNILFSAVHSRINGFRAHGEMKTSLINGIVQVQPDSLNELIIRLSWENSPLAEDPGALTSEQMKDNPTQASLNNLKYNAGEAVSQGRIGFFYNRIFNPEQELQFNAYFNSRNFNNRLPFEQGGIVDLIRNYGGFNLLYLHASNFLGYSAQLAGGLEFADQRDDRKRYNNLNGSKGELIFNQEEQYINTAIFGQQDIHFTQRWVLNLGLRYDIVNVRVQDLFIEDGIGSGKRTLQGMSGTIGTRFRMTDNHNLYGNISSGFETPTLIELTNNPVDNRGLNPTLNPQQAVNYEIGMKGVLTNKFRYEMALFMIDVYDELLPYELDSSPGRSYYRNAGRSRHNGLEFGIHGYLTTGLTFALSYTYSRFYFIDYQLAKNNFRENSIPGIPEHMGYAEFFYLSTSGIYGRFEIQGRSKLYVNDANTAIDDPYAAINIQTGYRLLFNRWYVEPFFGINNILDVSYSDNIRINAFGERYYEPAPGLNFYGGVNIHIGN